MRHGTLPLQDQAVGSAGLWLEEPDAAIEISLSGYTVWERARNERGERRERRIIDRNVVS